MTKQTSLLVIKNAHAHLAENTTELKATEDKASN